MSLFPDNPESLVGCLVKSIYPTRRGDNDLYYDLYLVTRFIRVLGDPANRSVVCLCSTIDGKQYSIDLFLFKQAYQIVS